METATGTASTNDQAIRRLKLFTPRPSQRRVIASTARFMIVDCGRRWGKSLTGLNWLQENAWQNPHSMNWWIAPVHGQAKMVFDVFMRANRNSGCIASVNLSDKRAELLSGGIIEFKSADNPDSLRGAGVHRAVIDEAARVKREAFEDVLRPALSDTGGRVMFTSTPKGRNWFYELWTRGQDRTAWPDYESWLFPTADNPKVPADDIEQARLTLPDDVFRQENLAEFLEDSAGVFRGVSECIGSQASDPVVGRSYLAGLDLAKHVDFTVLTIIDDLGRQVYFTRLQKLDWPYQKEFVAGIIQKYGALLLIDASGVGDPIFDDFQRAGLPVQGYKFTQDSKKRLIQSLMISIEQRKIQLLDEPVQTNELQIFEYQMNPSGTVTYSAPEGYHDDCVIALALANWLRENQARPDIFVF